MNSVTNVLAIILVLVNFSAYSISSPSNGDEVLVQPTASSPQFVTQTVYGFLDFTTTIGNTIMVFSPKSSPPPEPVKPSITAAGSNEQSEATSTVETKPPATVVTPKSDIKPSKPLKSTVKQAPSSVVHVMAHSESDAETVHPVKAISIAETRIDDSAPPPFKVIASKVQVVEEHKRQPKISSHVEVAEETSGFSTVLPQKIHPSSVIGIQSSEAVEPILPVENNINDPEYEFLSRQPSEFAEETYRLHNIKTPNSKFNQKSKSVADSNVAKKNTHPTGLVTKLGGTVIKDGATTVHETSVIGTYISGKYAQVLQSTSHIFHNSKPKIVPTSSLRILKTAAPHLAKGQLTGDALAVKQIHASTAEVGDDHERSSRRPLIGSSSFKNRFRNNRPAAKDETEYQDVSTTHVEIVKPSAIPNYKKNRVQNKAKSPEPSTVSAYSEPAVTPAYSNRRNKTPRHGFNKPQSAASPQSSSPNTASDNNYSRRFKPKINPSATDANSQQSSSLYKFKLNRAPGRWQYKTSPKPRVTIRKQNSAGDNAEEPTSPTPITDTDLLAHEELHEAHIINPVASETANSRSDEGDLDSSSSVNGDVLNDDDDTLYNVIENRKLPIETLKVEISTPADFKDTYYEIATIKSPYTFQVGSVKNTRYITVTSTFEKVLDPEPSTTTTLNGPLTENILATTAHIDKEHNLLDSSIATLPPLLLSSDVETPPLETLTETFSTTQTMLKTHILPVLHEGGGNATSYTLTQTYIVTRLVTAIKTLPPMDVYQFNPSKALREFNSKLDEAGSELNLELDFGDNNENDDEDGNRQELPLDFDLATVGSEFDLSDVDKSNIPEAHLRPKKKSAQKTSTAPSFEEVNTPTTPKVDHLLQNLSPDQLQQLAFLRLINPNAQLPQIVTTSKPIVKLETVFESHVIPVFNGVSTSFSTISRPVATVSKTDYEIVTSTLALPQLPQLPQPPPINPFQQQPQQQFQINTQPIVTQTMVTQTKSKVLKLTFGAKTAYTTLFSSTVVPTLLTTYITQSIPFVQQTAAFPGYFPAPYAPFPYVG